MEVLTLGPIKPRDPQDLEWIPWKTRGRGILCKELRERKLREFFKGTLKNNFSTKDKDLVLCSKGFVHQSLAETFVLVTKIYS